MRENGGLLFADRRFGTLKGNDSNQTCRLIQDGQLEILDLVIALEISAGEDWRFFAVPKHEQAVILKMPSVCIHGFFRVFIPCKELPISAYFKKTFRIAHIAAEGVLQTAHGKHGGFLGDTGV